MFKGAVTDLTALQALDATLQIDGVTFFVINPAVGEAGAPYQFRRGSNLPLLGSIVLAGTDGQWIKQGRLVHRATTNPNVIPPLRNIEWVGTLINPSRIITWRSQGTTAFTDWKAQQGTLILANISPPGQLRSDYAGQIYRFGSLLYMATEADSMNSWSLLSY